MISLGIESTAHTFGIGIVEHKNDKTTIISDVRDTYAPKEHGIHPTEARDHHDSVKEKVLESALKQANLTLEKIDIICYSKGPGLPPALKVGMEFAKSLAKKSHKPLVEVNHPIAHIEIGRLYAGCNDPIILYVSGGNTQIIGFAAGKYRVFGETQDIPIGNAIDTFIREAGLVGSLGGPTLEKKAEKGKKFVELPYVVKGMDLSFSGIVTSALQKLKKEKLNDVCFSFQETCYAMLTEVTERALAHTKKKELLLTGGVAASRRLRSMLDTMCKERGAQFFVCPKEYTGDNGAMIAYAGLLAKKKNMYVIDPEKADFIQRWRIDDVDWFLK
ncbi:KEOPS complex N(6)-L-threonylcarbamoyladenine synthase Kae1 [Candidatus Aenigmatarchaeota archaeon]